MVTKERNGVLLGTQCPQWQDARPTAVVSIEKTLPCCHWVYTLIPRLCDTGLFRALTKNGDAALSRNQEVKAKREAAKFAMSLKWHDVLVLPNGKGHHEGDSTGCERTINRSGGFNWEPRQDYHAARNAVSQSNYIYSQTKSQPDLSRMPTRRNAATAAMRESSKAFRDRPFREKGPRKVTMWVCVQTLEMRGALCLLKR